MPDASPPDAAREPPAGVCGRFAPSPTGGLHLGSALVALAAWLSARAQGGRFVLRIEDLDGPRVVPGAAAQQLAELRWLGLDWDEGPGFPGLHDDRGPHAPYRQSERGALYEAALARLAAAGRLFPCRRSRKDLAALASAPHGADGLPPYPRAWRPAALAPGWYAARPPDAALRFLVADGPEAFTDRVMGPQVQDVAAETGDVVLRRRDGVVAYQLAVVVDDLAMGVTEVVRGADLLDSTGRQRQLARALGGAVPAYAHLPLVVNAAGEKLSKRDGALTLAALRDGGTPPETVVGHLAHALGLAEAPAPTTPAALVGAFAWDRVRRTPWTAPDAR